MPPKGKKGPSMLPAFYAADVGDDEAMAVLLTGESLKSVMSQRNKDGWSVLHQAAFSGHVSIVKQLLAAGAEVSGKCRDGDTPLHYASAQGAVDIAQALVDAGAKLRVKDNDGEEPLDVAQTPKVKRALDAMFKKKEEETEADEEEAADEEA